MKIALLFSVVLGFAGVLIIKADDDKEGPNYADTTEHQNFEVTDQIHDEAEKELSDKNGPSNKQAGISSRFLDKSYNTSKYDQEMADPGGWCVFRCQKGNLRRRRLCCRRRHTTKYVCSTGICRRRRGGRRQTRRWKWKK